MRAAFAPDYTRGNPYQRLLADALAAHGITVRMLPRKRRAALPLLWPLLRRGRVEVLHLHWPHVYIEDDDGRSSRWRVARFRAEMAVLKLLRVRVVWTVHNLGRHDRQLDPVTARFNARLFRLSRAVVVHCEEAARRLVETAGVEPGRRSRLTVIPHGNYVGAYEDVVSRDEARASLGLPPDATVLLFLGAVRPYKGVDELVTAFSTLTHPDLRLVIAGKPVNAAIVAELTELAERDPRIILRLSRIPDAELQVHLNAADAVVLPFRDILTSGSALLAMSFGKAVVGPRLGCLPEALGDGCPLLYDVDRGETLHDGLERALHADLRAEGERNRDRALAFGGWAAIGEATAAAYGIRSSDAQQAG